MAPCRAPTHSHPIPPTTPAGCTQGAGKVAAPARRTCGPQGQALGALWGQAKAQMLQAQSVGGPWAVACAEVPTWVPGAACSLVMRRAPCSRLVMAAACSLVMMAWVPCDLLVSGLGFQPLCH